MHSKEKIEVWLSRVCEQVRWRPARASVKKELADHIEDQTEAYLAAGIPREEAQLRALEQMGDADMVGEQLNAAWQPGRLPLQALCAVGLLVFWANFSAYFIAISRFSIKIALLLPFFISSIIL